MDAGPLAQGLEAVFYVQKPNFSGDYPEAIRKGAEPRKSKR